jgi:hypothetical protein
MEEERQAVIVANCRVQGSTHGLNGRRALLTPLGSAGCDSPHQRVRDKGAPYACPDPNCSMPCDTVTCAPHHTVGSVALDTSERFDVVTRYKTVPSIGHFFDLYQCSKTIRPNMLRAKCNWQHFAIFLIMGFLKVFSAQEALHAQATLAQTHRHCHQRRDGRTDDRMLVKWLIERRFRQPRRHPRRNRLGGQRRRFPRRRGGW